MTFTHFEFIKCVVKKSRENSTLVNNKKWINQCYFCFWLLFNTVKCCQGLCYHMVTKYWLLGDDNSILEVFWQFLIRIIKSHSLIKILSVVCKQWINSIKKISNSINVNNNVFKCYIFYMSKFKPKALIVSVCTLHNVPYTKILVFCISIE